jgi:hypothetical protein
MVEPPVESVDEVVMFVTVLSSCHWKARRTPDCLLHRCLELAQIRDLDGRSNQHGHLVAPRMPVVLMFY